MNNSPLVSIIIVNYNGKHLLESCFNSLSQIKYPNYEVILVDNDSTDNSIEYIKNNHPSTIIEKLDNNYGFAKPNNIGVKKSKGDYILFLNNDTIVSNNFIDELVTVLEKNSEIGACQSLLLTINNDVDSSGDFMDPLGICFSSKKRVTQVTEIFSAKAASMMVRKEIFEQLKGFDEKFFATFEDVDFGWRMWIMGYKIVVVPDSIVYHLGSKTLANMKNEMAYHGFKNQLSMKITNFERFYSIKSIVSFFFIYGFKMIRVLLDYRFHGKTRIRSIPYEEKIAQKPNLKAIIKAIFWILKNQHYLFHKYGFVNKSRKYSTRELMNFNLIKN